MTKKTARIKVVADGKVQYVDVDVTVDDPPAKATPITPAATTATPTSARISPFGFLLILVFIGGAILLFGVLSHPSSSSSTGYSADQTALAVTNEYLKPTRTQAADQALSAISVTVTNNHCKGSSNCADYTITLENGAFYEQWQPVFHFQSGKTSVGYCDYFTNGASCFLSKNGFDLNSDPAIKVCFEALTGIESHIGKETTQICKDITD